MSMRSLQGIRRKKHDIFIILQRLIVNLYSEVLYITRSLIDTPWSLITLVLYTMRTT